MSKASVLVLSLLLFLLSSCTSFLGAAEEVAEDALDCEIEKVEERRESNHHKASMLKRKHRR